MDVPAHRARRRARNWQLVFQVGFFALGVALIARLYGWQVVQHQDIVRRATSEHVKQETIPADRGAIYDSTGEPFVSNVSYDLVFAVPSSLDNPTVTAEKLAPILGTTREALIERFKASEHWVSLAHKQPPDVSAQIRALGLKGIGLQPESKRVYPAGSLASQVLGFTSYDGKGQYGIEWRYNDELSGTPGRLTVERDVAGNQINLNDRTMDPPKHGADLYLTIDHTMQFIVEQQLAASIKQHDATGGSVIVMDPRTGAILAMANYPTYNPNTFETTEGKLFVNTSISQAFEPGSTFKVLTMSMGIDQRLVTPETTMIDKGSEVIGGHTIWDWDRKVHGEVSMVDVLAHSLNLGAAFVGRKVGAPDFYRYVRNYGFGVRTGIDLQGEVDGTVRTPDGGNWYVVDLSTNSFGQGLTATPLQMVTAVAAIANGGTMMRPYVVRQVVRNGEGRSIVPVIVGHPVSPTTARTVTDMMVQVLLKGEGWTARVPGYQVAGKTGTAQIAENGVYIPDATIASFVGFVPAQNPAFVMLVKIDRPKDTPWGSETAGPLFQSIARELLLYMHVAPTEPIPTPTPLPATKAAGTLDSSRKTSTPEAGGVATAPPRAQPTRVPSGTR